MLWAQWILCSLDPSTRTQDAVQSVITQYQADQFQLVAEICLQEGYIETLHEAMLVFMPVRYFSRYKVRTIDPLHARSEHTNTERGTVRDHAASK